MQDEESGSGSSSEESDGEEDELEEPRKIWATMTESEWIKFGSTTGTTGSPSVSRSTRVLCRSGSA